MALGLRRGVELGVAPTLFTMGTGPPTSMGSSSSSELLLLLWLPESSESLLEDEPELELDELRPMAPGPPEGKGFCETSCGGAGGRASVGLGGRTGSSSSC